jgi:hypothetical protein
MEKATMFNIKKIGKNMMDYCSIIPFNLSRINKNQMRPFFSSTGSEATHELDITTHNLNIEEKLSEKDVKLNLIQKSLLHIFGKVHVGEYKKENWPSAMSFYAFNCKKHGVQISYPNGWKKTLRCPVCYESI